MDDNNKPDQSSGSSKTGSGSSGSRRRRRPRKKRPSAGMQNNNNSTQTPTGSTSSRKTRSASGGRGGRPSENNTNRQHNQNSSRSKSKSKRRRRRPKGRGGVRGGTIVDAMGLFIRKGPPIEPFLDKDAEIKACRERFQEELNALKTAEHVCVVCREVIKDPLDAVRYQDSKDLCHLECARKEILNVEKLENDEQLVYVGSGEYAIYQERKNRGKVSLLFRKRVSYLESDAHSDQG